MKLDLCSNTRCPEGYEGVDIVAFPGVKHVCDINEGLSFRYSVVDEIRAHDALEHIKDGIKLMKECWRVLKDGGILDILVPSTDGRGAFQDLTHVSFWNENSFRYWINPAGWMDYYRGECLFEASVLETTPMSDDSVCHVRAVLTTIKSNEWFAEYNRRNKNGCSRI